MGRLVQLCTMSSWPTWLIMSHQGKEKVFAGKQEAETDGKAGEKETMMSGSDSPHLDLEPLGYKAALDNKDSDNLGHNGTAVIFMI